MSYMPGPPFHGMAMNWIVGIGGLEAKDVLLGVWCSISVDIDTFMNGYKYNESFL